MLNFMLHSLQPSHGAVNFILAQLYIGVYTIPEEDTVQTPLVRLAVRKLEENHD